MRRTESRDALRGEVCVGSFVWDADEDGPIPEGTSYLRGAVPEDSIALGGYLHVTEELLRNEGGPGSLFFTIADRTAEFPFPVDPGWHRVSFMFEDVSLIGRVDSEEASRLQVVSDQEVIAGQFCLYVFYIYAEGRQPDIPGPFPSDALLLDDDVFFVLMDNDIDKILLDV